MPISTLEPPAGLNNLIEAARAGLAGCAHKRLWLISDLQQRDPAVAAACLEAAMADFDRLALPVDAICYLGDATEGANRADLDQMIAMQLRYFAALSLPVYYTLGNHEFDYYRACAQAGKRPEILLYEAVKGLPGWHVPDHFSDFMFTADLDEFALVLFSDHGAADGSWHTTNGAVRGAVESYPYTAADAERARSTIEAFGKDVFTFSHYAFSGGNRASELLSRILPLPENHRAHFHGHAHLGDAAWAGKDLYRKIACIDDHASLQFDISSLDNRRGTTVRSAFLEYYGSGRYGVFFRDHQHGLWEDCYLSETSSRRKNC